MEIKFLISLILISNEKIQQQGKYLLWQNPLNSREIFEVGVFAKPSSREKLREMFLKFSRENQLH